MNVLWGINPFGHIYLDMSVIVFIPKECLGIFVILFMFSAITKSKRNSVERWQKRHNYISNFWHAKILNLHLYMK